MRLRNEWVLAVTIALVLIAPVAWVGLRRASSVERIALTVPHARLDIGTVWSDRAFKWQLPVENSTSQPVEILRLSASCSCTSISPTSLVIPAQGLAHFDLGIDLSLPCGVDLATAEYPLRIMIIPEIAGDAGRTMPWALVGRVRQQVSFECVSWRPREPIVVGAQVASDGVAFKIHEELRFKQAECQPPIASVRVNQIDGSSREYRASITPNTGLSVGEYKAAIVIKLSSGTGTRVPDAVLPIEFVVVNDLAIEPAGLQLGAVTIGQQRTEIVALRSRTGKAFAISDEVRSPSTVGVTRLGPGDDRFRIDVKCTESGFHTESVAFVADEQAGARHELLLKISYHGVP